jgi:hypothetical protein
MRELRVEGEGLEALLAVPGLDGHAPAAVGHVQVLRHALPVVGDREQLAGLGVDEQPVRRGLVLQEHHARG